MAAAKRLRRNYKCLKALKKLPAGKRRELLESASNDFILCLCDCANNVLQGNVKLKPKEKTQLRRHKNTLRALVKGGGSRNLIKKKRKLLIQKGGFLPALLAPILGSLASGLVGTIFGRRSE